jgi:hypothetical protein
VEETSADDKCGAKRAVACLPRAKAPAFFLQRTTSNGDKKMIILLGEKMISAGRLRKTLQSLWFTKTTTLV